MTLISRIHKKFNINFVIKDIFLEANIRNLSKKIDLLNSIKQMQIEASTILFKNKIEI